MQSLIVVTRRLLWIALVALTGGVILAWWRDRMASPAGAPAEWPPLAPEGAPSGVRPPAETTPTDTAPTDTAPTDTAPTDTATADTAPATAMEPAAQPRETASWAEPTADGSCPDGFPVKAKESSGIFHVPGGRFYERTNPDRCYASAAAAEADGYRRSKS